MEMKPKEFLALIADIAESFRKKIELEVEAFEVDEEARLERRKKALDPQTGYRFFAKTYFPHYLNKPDSKLHDDLMDHILPTVLFGNGHARKGIIAPRGAAKSTHVSCIFPLHALITQRKHYICLVMDAFDQAAVAIESIKAELEFNPRLAYDFPEIMGVGRVWREGMIVTSANVKIEGFGTGKKVRGRRHGPHRPDLIIFDDIENDENVESPRQRDKLYRWVNKAAMKLGPTDGSIDALYVGTILHFDAVIKRMAKKPGWNFKAYQAILTFPDRMDLWDRWEELFINDDPNAEAFYLQNKAEMDQGAVLNWPQMQSLLFLMKERAGDHESFESEYQNNPVSKDNPFQDLRYWVSPNRNWLYFGAIDPSLGKRGSNGDPSAILVGGFDKESGVLDVVEASISRRHPDIITEDAISLQREYNCLMWFVESVQFQDFFREHLMKAAMNAKPPIAMPCMPVMPITDKNLRIQRLQPPTKAGLIRYHQTQKTLIDQLQQWPRADHDDGPDCLEMLWDNAVKMSQASVSIGGIHQGAGRKSSFNDGYSLG